jgi:hypothetical protein
MAEVLEGTRQMHMPSVEAKEAEKQATKSATHNKKRVR